MTWRSSASQLIPGKWLSSAYAGHGINGAVVKAQTASGTNGGSGLIQACMTVNDSNEYRLQVVNIPSGYTINENGSGSCTTGGERIIRAVLRCYENGVEVP